MHLVSEDATYNQIVPFIEVPPQEPHPPIDWSILDPYQVLRTANCRENKPMPDVCRKKKPHNVHSETNVDSNLKKFNMDEDDLVESWKKTVNRAELSYYGIGDPMNQLDVQKFNKVLNVSYEKVKAPARVDVHAAPKDRATKPPIPEDGILVLNHECLAEQIGKMPTVRQKLNPNKAATWIYCPDPTNADCPFCDMPKNDLFGCLREQRAPPALKQRRTSQTKPKRKTKRQMLMMCEPYNCDLPENACTLFKKMLRQPDPKYIVPWQSEAESEAESEPDDFDQLYERLMRCFEKKQADSLQKTYTTCCVKSGKGRGKDGGAGDDDDGDDGASSDGKDKGDGEGDQDKGKGKGKEKPKPKDEDKDEKGKGKGDKEGGEDRKKKEKKGGKPSNKGKDKTKDQTTNKIKHFEDDDRKGEPEPKKPEFKPEPKKPESKPEPKKPESEPEPKKPESGEDQVIDSEDLEKEKKLEDAKEKKSKKKKKKKKTSKGTPAEVDPECPCELCEFMNRRSKEPDSPLIKEMRRKQKQQELRDYYKEMCAREYAKTASPKYPAPQHKCDPICCDNNFCEDPQLKEYCDCLDSMKKLQSLLGKKHRIVDHTLEFNKQDLQRRINHCLTECLP